MQLPSVASFTDAWIETAPASSVPPADVASHLLQMRGLKPPTVSNINLGNCRIFYRCVD